MDLPIQSSIFSLPEIIGNIFVFTESIEAESLVCKSFHKVSQSDLIGKFFFLEFSSIIGISFFNFDRLIGIENEDSWFVKYRKAIHWIQNLLHETCFLRITPRRKINEDIVLSEENNKNNADVFSASIISIYKAAYQRIVDVNFLRFIHIFPDYKAPSCSLEYGQSLEDDQVKKIRSELLDENGVYVKSTDLSPPLLQPLLLSRVKLPLTILPPEISYFKELHTCSFLDNKIKFIPECFCNLVNLTSINLSNNQLQCLPDSMSKLVNLTHIDLSGEQQANFPECIVKLKKLFSNLTIALR